jgi:anti-anti-sigma factor
MSRQREPRSADFELLNVDGRPSIRGDCDVAAVREIEGWLATFDTEPLEVDLSQVTFFDSSALRALLNVKRRNRHMRVINPSESVRKVLDFTGTAEYLVDGRDIFT